MFIFVVNSCISMKHIYNYIIKISNELNDTFKTESGMEWYGDKDFNKDRLSNRYATVMSQPILFDGELIEEGTEVLIDPSTYYHSTHGDDDVKQYTTNTIDMQEGIYAIEPQNIVLYKQDNTWRGYMNNFLGECVTEQKEDKTIGSVIVEVGRKVKTDTYDVVYTNTFLEDHDVLKGDRLYMKPNYGVSVWILGKEHTWLRSVDVLAKTEDNEN